MKGVIDRRLLVNYRIDPEVMRGLDNLVCC